MRICLRLLPYSPLFDRELPASWPHRAALAPETAPNTHHNMLASIFRNVCASTSLKSWLDLKAGPVFDPLRPAAGSTDCQDE
jgi:hypothetical protein